ncbi:MAG: hypothetical protein QOI80_3658, partial [Solirubrobacteraceae bacterium]|nr:hypothetical protein [Solirubrobacteraceae bacterium]
GRELRAVVEGLQTADAARTNYTDLHESHRFDFEALYRVQQSIRHLHGPVLDRLTRLFTRRKLSLWAFGKYLNICHPDLLGSNSSRSGRNINRCATSSAAGGVEVAA